MLINFSVENYMSYKERQTFSMIAGKQTRHSDHILEVKGRRILRGSFFFGANASGKSNLFSAIRFAQNIVTDGLRNNILTNKHFRVDKDCANQPGVFQFDIYTNGHFYSYGFAISYIKAIVEEEWLFQCDSTEIAIFERSIENGRPIIRTDFNFSDSEERQKFEIFSENVPDNKLFLSEIAERKLTQHEDFFAYRNVKNWMDNLKILTPNSKYVNKAKLLSENEGTDRLVKLLRDFDTGIEDVELKRETMENVLSFLPNDRREEVMQSIEDVFNGIDHEKAAKRGVKLSIKGKSFVFEKKDNQILASQLVMSHGNNTDLFQLADESDGTQRLFDLIPVYQVGKQSRVIFIDELDRSFHTKLVIKYIEQFYQKTCGTESQLIASVHDSNVMDLSFLRQDEIWFVERQPDHSSKLYSLNKFQVRFDKKVAKDYLLGRYGAIPCFSQLDTSEIGGE